MKIRSWRYSAGNSVEMRNASWDGSRGHRFRWCTEWTHICLCFVLFDNEMPFDSRLVSISSSNRETKAIDWNNAQNWGNWAKIFIYFCFALKFEFFQSHRILRIRWIFERIEFVENDISVRMLWYFMRSHIFWP